MMKQIIMTDNQSYLVRSLEPSLLAQIFSIGTATIYNRVRQSYLAYSNAILP